ncbi:Hsp20/alpha crystallin family protein [Micromonospora sp. 15K316]|uniref:Hsp20/alpha crystallin family protein n=1 Tax=Micromonospora sp. 15K316 TaxID=2530376 RepID=UPI00104D4F0C|nr:Hsp20/alpha crystallin family protein [Micromonospora sp. 15K316]TDC40663.1 Hsp20/alpha crystallin family protein [Micromonospora sp. 15K316]
MSTLSLWTRRDPFAEFDALVRQAFGPVGTRPTGFVPAAEVTRDGDDAVVRLELPGLDPDNDVAVEVDRDSLVVRGERRDERAEERDGRGLREVRYGSFRRSFRLPAHTTADAVSAAYDAGVLTVRVADAYAGRVARRIPVSSAGERPALAADADQPEQPTA